MFVWVVSCFLLLVWLSYGRYLLANRWLAHFVPEVFVVTGVSFSPDLFCNLLQIVLYVVCSHGGESFTRFIL